ncbi:phosphatidylserine/phosphatidylglycerophosphate/cardiolipin synthase-like enzyme [Methanomicrobium sp. W14]|uniref:phospholipase D-like domain-containing protein n=1 Tax=Methanomicrobium sp. W14 TaxID=2817839 RepID=UPI001AE434CF|nr:phosphatidylserine/phosphatidylglycerophosphate/cardiolipin synthase family protein [Methanomicrobium sp. W14]MBP2132357.1 phosphatidylserine/phosphatidylglycerophosphate/cardiolipin synthase-like enzyme [Methanomicrobium sp. W14]
MAGDYSGNILKSLEKPLTETFSFEDENLGPCWTYRNYADTDDKRSMRWVFHSNQRDFIVPQKNGKFITYLVEKIEEAKETICISSFLIQKTGVTDALIAAEKRGINIFILTAREEDLKNIDDDRLEGEDKIIKEHINLLNSFAEKILVRTCDSFHAKYIIIDPVSFNPFGLMMTCNATSAPMNGSNIEIATNLKNDEIKSFFAHFIYGFWKMANHELLENNKLTAVKKELAFKPQLGEITLPATTDKLFSLNDSILKLINTARKSITITAWSFDEGNKIVEALESASDRGVSIKIGTKQNKRNTKALLNVIAKGAEVFGHPRFHAKCVIVDGNKGLITTSNFTKLGLETGFETSVILDADEAQTMEPVISGWLKSCPWELKKDLLLRDANEKILQLNENKKDLDEISIVSEEKTELEDYMPDSLEKILGYTIQKSQAEREVKNLKNKKIQRLILSQKIIAPNLSANSKKEADIDDSPFDVYNSGKGKRFIVVKNWDDLKPAEEVARKIKAKIVVKKELL